MPRKIIITLLSALGTMGIPFFIGIPAVAIFLSLWSGVFIMIAAVPLIVLHEKDNDSSHSEGNISVFTE